MRKALDAILKGLERMGEAFRHALPYVPIH